MKKFFIPMFSAAAMFLSSCGSDKFSIEGSIGSEIPDSLYLVYVSDSDFVFPEVPVDTVVVRDGHFSWETIDYSEARYMNFQAVFKGTGQLALPMQMVLVPGENLTIRVDNGSFEITEPCSEFYRQAIRMIDTTNILVEELRSIFTQAQSPDADSASADQLMSQATQKLKEYEDFPFSYLKAHQMEEGALLTLAFNHSKILDSIQLFPDYMLKGRCANLIKNLSANRAKQIAKDEQLKNKIDENAVATAEGKMFADLVSMYNKRVYKLSDYVGTGKYVLADFWASWCGPCRKVSPELKEIYNQYAGDRFEIVGIAVNDEPANTMAAIEKDGIPYPQIINSGSVSAETYGFKEIPYFILFAPDGTILKRSLDIDEIKEALADKLGK